MNQRPQGLKANQRPQGLQAEKALTGFLQYKSAEGLAPVTVNGYERDLRLWLEYQGEIDIGKITSKHILGFLNYLRTEYVPRRITGDNSRKLAPKCKDYCQNARSPYNPTMSSTHCVNALGGKMGDGEGRSFFGRGHGLFPGGCGWS